YAPPALTRQWFLNGAYAEWPALRAQWETEFFKGDSESPQIVLPDMVLNLGASGASGTVQRQAYSALAGSLVRKEVYGADGPEQAAYPYTVTLASTTVTLLQAPREDVFGVYTVAQDQTAELDYERQKQDQRTTHSLVLSRDAYGQPVLAA